MTTNAESLYEKIGGEPKIRKLVNEFYDVMDTDERAKVIRELHPKDLKTSREKLFMFLSGWLGGEPLYVKKYGHPRLRARHMPFPIGENERDQWLYCMQIAMERIGMSSEIKGELESAFMRTADFMRNKAE